MVVVSPVAHFWRGRSRGSSRGGDVRPARTLGEGGVDGRVYLVASVWVGRGDPRHPGARERQAGDRQATRDPPELGERWLAARPLTASARGERAGGVAARGRARVGRSDHRDDFHARGRPSSCARCGEPSSFWIWVLRAGVMRELHPQTDARVCGFLYGRFEPSDQPSEPGLKSRDSTRVEASPDAMTNRVYR